MKKAVWIAVSLVAASTSVSAWAVNDSPQRLLEQNQWAQAQVCRKINNNLGRLACFDKTFDTPVKVGLNDENLPAKPKSWQWAMQSEHRRNPSEPGSKEFLLNKQNTPGLGMHIWLTAPAINSRYNTHNHKQPPVLMLSCVENISRVELVFPTPMKENRISVTVPNSPVVTQQWQSDSSGYILRSGRGLSAVRIMKSILSSSQLTLRSDVEAVNGLTFDTEHLSKLIKPMRSACSW
ncbi:type VI secretion system-associated protein TagO [Vibrio sp. S4M6]|nr:type VI secretion system-associated protein VasI [Vibrio sinus]MCL9781351.1 type VI secretion system-associated protein TagO [Vibrio sinus]